MKNRFDVVVVGAGPYGLSTAAHLRTIPGLQTRVFGQTMSFWQQNMPAGMFLRSPWSASHIADPSNSLTLDAYVAARGNHLPTPIPLDRFVDYGRWFQQQVAPDLDPRKIRQIRSAGDGFQLTTDDGEMVTSRRVVVATGIAPFARRSPEFNSLPASLVSHACDHSDLGGFTGKRVLVVGGGQSALESAALLHEANADVEIVMRKPQLRWLKWRAALLRIKPLGALLYSPRDVGPAGISQLVARPDCFRLFPRKWQDKMARRAILPAGAVWLQDRLKDVKVRTGRYVRNVTPASSRLRVGLDDGAELEFDHLLLGTGYQIDIAKYDFLSKELLSRIERIDGYPKLKRGLESSVPNLHFLGAPAAWSFGPVARFVSGTYYCVKAVTRKIASSN
jgi:cation diffusion facilitator CzcD-associated flavoprotein CzcO